MAGMYLMPYERGRLSGELPGISQKAFDGVLVIWDDDIPGLEVSDAQMQHRLVQGSYLAFSAVAGRSIATPTHSES